MNRSAILSLLALSLAGGMMSPGVGLAVPDRALTFTGCEEALLSEHLPAAEVEDNATTRAVTAVARRVEQAVAGRESFAEVAEDDSIWVDTCGQPYAVEPAREAPAVDEGSTPEASYPLSDTFNLSSLPGADKTIFLDFDGATYTKGGWVDRYGKGASLTFGKFSSDSDPGFSDDERLAIQTIYNMVAEDYAPFQVNVTTKRPPASALTRDSPGDSVYGLTALVSSSSSVSTDCGCGGLGFIGITRSDTDLSYHSPALVFANNLAFETEFIAETTSHELGHNFGLTHDGEIDADYHSGNSLWAPIMGVSYQAAQTQWSNGDYEGANNQQDDLDIIARTTGVRPDDHDETTADTPLPGGAKVSGILSSAQDTDSFRFTASGSTLIEVSPAPQGGNVDVKATLLDSSGKVVAVENPAPELVGYRRITGAGVNLFIELAPDTYTLQLAPTGATTSQGSYSAYGAIGAYTVTQRAAENLDPVVVRPAEFTMIKMESFSAKLTAEGGNGTYVWESLHAMPHGLGLSAKGMITGRAHYSGTYTIPIRATSNNDAISRSAQADFTFVVKESGTTPPPPPPADSVSLAGKTGLSAAKRGQKYKAKIFATDGTAPYSWTLTGALPKGLRFLEKPNFALIKGRPKKAKRAKGHYSFRVTVQDSGDDTASKTYRLRVR